MTNRMTTMFRAMIVLVVVAASLSACSADGSNAICRPERHSVARVWNEVTLEAIRRDFPAPTVHARNLYHLSVAMWDTWAAFEDTGAVPVIHRGDRVASSEPASADGPGPPADAADNREIAISFAAHSLLTARYRESVGGEESLARFDDTLGELCLEPEMAERPDSAAAFGRSVAEHILAESLDDGAGETDQYVARYEPVNEPLLTGESGTVMNDPNRWQQLEMAVAQTQNGLQLESDTQEYIGPQWGSVVGFAIEPSDDGLPVDPGPPPLLNSDTEDAFLTAAVDVVRAASALDPADGLMMDIGPAGRGANPLGTNDGRGRPENPVTGLPYETNRVPAADFHRVIAEFWADGPDSETPPGHWNTLANGASDRLDEYRIGGVGPEVDRLQWDLSLYLALNGALHDSAIAAWGAKRAYDYARPISMIRHLGGEGLLPLEDGLIEVITEQSAAPGQRHEELGDHVGQVAILSWAPEPVYFGEGLKPVRWILAADWMPYQRPTFVTPAFPGYVSGHSTFSRAAAEILTAITGSEYFPEGIATHDVPAGELEFDDGPSQAIQLQWATYYDAADEAGLSRIYGGIHVEADDLAGRTMGSQVGLQAWDRVQDYFPAR